MKVIIVKANIIIIYLETFKSPKILPAITPKEPPDTKIALWLNFPLEERKVTSAPFTCIKAFPKQSIITAVYFPKFIGEINRAITIKITPIKPRGILG